MTSKNKIISVVKVFENQKSIFASNVSSYSHNVIR